MNNPARENANSTLDTRSCNFLCRLDSSQVGLTLPLILLTFVDVCATQCNDDQTRICEDRRRLRRAGWGAAGPTRSANSWPQLALRLIHIPSYSPIRVNRACYQQQMIDLNRALRERAVSRIQ